MTDTEFKGFETCKMMQVHLNDILNTVTYIQIQFMIDGSITQSNVIMSLWNK